METGPTALLEALNAVLESSEDALLVVDGSGRILRTNAPARGMVPDAPDLEGRHVHEFLHREDRGRLVPQDGSPREERVRVCLAPRIWRHLTVRVAPLGGDLRLVRLRDTVRERSSQESLREYAHVKAALDESFPVSMSDAHGTILYVNERFCRVSGYGRHELLGHNHRILQSGEHGPAFYRDLWDTVNGGRTWRGEVRNRRKDGGLYWVDMVIHPVSGSDGGFQRFIAIASPVDERKRAEEELRQARDEAREAAQVKGQFLSTMSHEIRTPLNAILGSAHLLERGAPRPDQEGTLRILRSSAQNLLHLVNDVLDFSKIEAGRLALESVPFELRPFLEGVRSGLELPARRKGLAYELSVDPALPDWIEGDPTRLGQVLTNLVSNAVKFTERGFVRLDARLLHRSREGLRIRFSVEDSGIGIPADQTELVFEAFVQAQSSTTRRFGGTGLGLSISRSLLELMGSRPEVESLEGRGSRFWFDLWLNEGRPETRDAGEGEDGGLAGMRVLLVEDNEFNVLVAGQFLSSWGVAWEAVPEGRQAVEAVRAGGWDLVLMDLQMPGMDGYEATRLIRAFDRETPILALTASAQLDRRDKAFRLGMNDYVTKPIDPDLLLSKLRGYLPGGRLDTLPLFRLD